MRAILVLAAFAALFGAAALWQSRRVEALQRERELAMRVQSGEFAEDAGGALIPAGWAAVTVGRPSGVDPVAPPESGEPPGPGASVAPETPRASDGDEDRRSSLLNDFEVRVEPGQSLSKIARAHYGTAARDVVLALARYNGLADEDELVAGQKLLLPSIDRLERTREE
jgi:nucleoid-associated protein YgaU